MVQDTLQRCKIGEAASVLTPVATIGGRLVVPIIQRIVERKLGVSIADQGLRPVGRQPAEEVVRRLLESDLYVLPTRIDNSPNSLCEAMLVGLPVVTTNVGGIPSLVEHQREGLLVPPGDEWALAGSIRQLAQNPDLADGLAARARQRAERRHDPLTVARSLIGIYREILATDRSATDSRVS